MRNFSQFHDEIKKETAAGNEKSLYNYLHTVLVQSYVTRVLAQVSATPSVSAIVRLHYVCLKQQSRG